MQLGAAVDYSIIYTWSTSSAGAAWPRALPLFQAVEKTAQPIITSLRLTVACLGIYFVASSPINPAGGLLIARGALISVIEGFLHPSPAVQNHRRLHQTHEFKLGFYVEKSKSEEHVDMDAVVQQIEDDGQPQEQNR